jgi:hypothetical protein
MVGWDVNFMKPDCLPPVQRDYSYAKPAWGYALMWLKDKVPEPQSKSARVVTTRAL